MSSKLFCVDFEIVFGSILCMVWLFFTFYFLCEMLFSAINLGCSKNLVDTQYLLGKVLSNNSNKNQLVYCPDPYDDEVSLVFLNTCGFIKSGRDEMLEVAHNLLNHNKKVCIVWCGLQYFENVDKDSSDDEHNNWNVLLQDPNIQLLSRNDFDKVSLEELLLWYSSKRFDDFSFPKVSRAYTNMSQGFEYVKIAEWCMNNCSFCIIPQIRWSQKSQSIEDVLWEVRDLISQWIKEIILISQDTTRYGVDRYGQAKLLDLLQEIDWLEGDFVYRLLYLYPDIMTFWWFDKFKKLKKFVPYFDLPLQHINSDLLQKMWRFSDTKKIKDFLKYIRENFDESYIRTNFIVWFPWETQVHVDELAQFIQEWWFDTIALFEYHDEKLARSSALSHKVSDSLISERFAYLKGVVDTVSTVQKVQTSIWYIMWFKDDVIIVRPWLHAPEIDGYVDIPLAQIIENMSGWDELQLGDLVRYRL